MVNAVLVLASLWTNFVNPPISARPWCYWWWTNGHVDHETITADLESMKALGFGGVLMFDSRGYWDDDEHVRNPLLKSAGVRTSGARMTLSRYENVHGWGLGSIRFSSSSKNGVTASR